MNTPNVMIDLETLGTNPNSMVTCFAAVSFLPKTGHVLSTFYERIDLDSYTSSSLQGKFTFDPTTLTWWMEQTADAKKEAFVSKPRTPINIVLDKFLTWYNQVPGAKEGFTKVWSQGAAFDIVIVEYLLSIFDHKPPWRFYNVRDTRTLYDVADISYKNVILTDKRYPDHHALGDCIRQVEAVRQSLEKCRTTKA